MEVPMAREEIQAIINNPGIGHFDGRDAWHKVEEIERRQKEDFSKIYTEDGLDKKKLFQVKLACFAAALIITLILWANGIIHEMSIAFYGE